MQEENNNENITPESTPKKINLLGVALALFLAIGAFFSGLQTNQIIDAGTQGAGIFSIFSSSPAKVQAVDPAADMTEFWAVWKLLDERFIVASSTKVVTSEEKLYGAIAGLVSAYDDPYTVFMPPVQSSAFAEDISGNFTGIGMEVGKRDNIITVIAPLVGTPAESAGLLAGDLVLKINGESTEGLLIEEAVKRIRGERGTDVTLTVFREGDLEPKDIVVTRDIITIPTVKTELDKDVFIISLYSFNAVAEAKMVEAIQDFKKSGATKLVLDVRGNPGGYLQGAVSIAGFFLPSGKVAVRERHGEADQERLYRTQGRLIEGLNPKNFVVLVDNGSASASEILAGALKEHTLATVIGVNTFGKGSVQELIDMPDGSALKVTIARWFTPNGTSISEGGLAPDITIKRTPQQRLDKVDPQKDAALLFLAGKTLESEIN